MSGPKRHEKNAGKTERRSRFRRGHIAEYRAALALILKGFRISARRYKVKGGEIDLIARKGDLVAFVEVKARSSVEAAMEAVAPQAQRRIENAADQWLRRQPDHARLTSRFDIVAVLPRRWPVHIPNAWTAR
ncbi:YraN family protein [Fulvimarina sp. MAC8]|uniref:YraN family protein n=1 Tax=Fulvimarina sp. MAC8 TaxID=3162874 RepID=UPI0032EF6EE6